MMNIRNVLGTAGLLALAACGGGDDKTGGGNASAETEAARGGAADVKLRPGQWEMRAEVNAPGMPKEVADMMKAQGTTTTMCVTEEEATRSDANIFTGKKDSNCTTEGFEAKGGRVKGTITCAGTGTEGGGRMKMVVDGSFNPESYEVTTKMDMEGVGGEGMTMETKVNGRRIGDCPANAKG